MSEIDMQRLVQPNKPVAMLDQFARRIIRSRTVWTISTEKGLARLPSRSTLGSQVNLIWTTPALAEPWMPRFLQPRLNPIWLADVISDVLPKLRRLNRLLGCDWTGATWETETEPARFQEGLRRAAFAAFVADARARNTVWILEDDAGPAFAACPSHPSSLFLPCWSTRAAAELACTGFWRDMVVSAIGKERFIERTLVWLKDIGRGLSLSHGLGVPLEAAPDDVATRLRGRRLQRAVN